MAHDPNIVRLTADQYDVRLQALSDHIKMMVNTGVWTGKEAQVAADIRWRLKRVMRDAHQDVQTIQHILTPR